MKIKNIETSNNIFLAPMAGVNDVGFRLVCAQCGAGMTTTEMISAKSLVFNSKRGHKILLSEDSSVRCVQIFGHEPEVMAAACKDDRLKNYDVIDINMGCPAQKIFKNGDGCALMKNIDLAREIIKACVRSTDKPITVKFRLGIEPDKYNAIEFAKMCEEAGASAITIHGRFYSEGYSGNVHYDKIAEIVSSVGIPVIGSGDIVDNVTYKKMLDTGVSAVTIGRGAQGNPGIFSLLQNIIPKNKKELLDIHLNTLKKYYDNKFLSAYMRKHFLWYLSGIIGANKTKVEIVTENDLNIAYEKTIKLLDNNNKK